MACGDLLLILHHSQKPSNILINQNGTLKVSQRCYILHHVLTLQIGDFGLARVEGPRMTGSISTPYYRAPEIMLDVPVYGTSVDIWSTGCVLAEMLEGHPLFPSQNSMSNLITGYL